MRAWHPTVSRIWHRAASWFPTRKAYSPNQGFTPSESVAVIQRRGHRDRRHRRRRDRARQPKARARRDELAHVGAVLGEIGDARRYHRHLPALEHVALVCGRRGKVLVVNGYRDGSRRGGEDVSLWYWERGAIWLMHSRCCRGDGCKKEARAVRRAFCQGQQPGAGACDRTVAIVACAVARLQGRGDREGDEGEGDGELHGDGEGQISDPCGSIVTILAVTSQERPES